MRINSCLLFLALAWSVPALAVDLECELQSTSFVLFKQATTALKAQVGQSPASINTNEQCQAAVEQGNNWFGEYDALGEGKSFAQCVCKSVFLGETSFEKAMGGTVVFAYKGLKSIGCSLGLGGCSKFDPAAFYANYKGIRDQGLSYEQVRAMYAPLLGKGELQSSSGYTDFVAECEASYQVQKQKEEEAQQLAWNQAISANAAVGWKIMWTATWGARCHDDDCRNSMAYLAEQRANAQANPATLAEYQGSTTDMFNAMNAKYNPIIDLKVAMSQAAFDQRQAIINDPGQPAPTRLGLMSCTYYLGRAGQYLCGEDAGFEACSRYVDQGSADTCYHTGMPGQRYAPLEAIAEKLTASGCDATEVGERFVCGDDKALELCRDYTRGGSHVSCYFVGEEIPVAPPIMQPMAPARSPVRLQRTIRAAPKTPAQSGG
jgi:hypothetical protein